MQEKTSTWNNGLIWFGAAVSIAEIMTGTLIAPLGFSKGLWAILLGHLIGCTLLFFAGLIGAKSEKSAMESVKMSFGQKGSILFSVLNVLQLVGWTAVMIIGGAKAIDVISKSTIGFEALPLWCILIGLLIIVWVLIGIRNLGKLNAFTMSALFLLTIVMNFIIFSGASGQAVSGDMTFGAAVELSVAMPLSWLPLISDYTRCARKPVAATVVSTITYFVASCWMYIIGLGAALFTGQSDIAQIMVQAGLGITAAIIVIGSTVTTTFLDAYSAGVSFTSITKKLDEKWVAVIVCVIGTLLAIFTPIEQFEDFLYFIGSVFAPMIAILIADYFVLHQDWQGRAFQVSNLVIWACGFVLYRLFMQLDTVVGNTLPVMVIVFVVCLIVGYLRKKLTKQQKSAEKMPQTK